ncbi:MAG: biotin transporter BioY [Pseudomonadota bacterium]
MVEATWRGNTLVRDGLMVVAGILALSVAAQIRVPIGPVPITMGTFAVLTIAAAYGPRLGLMTILGYLAVGAVGFDVFASSTAENNGITYMLGASGGYLFGYVLATLILGWAARRGWDRAVPTMVLAMLLGNVAIYVPGLLWLNGFAESWAQTLEWGLTPFLLGDGLKVALAALLVPALWRILPRTR